MGLPFLADECGYILIFALPKRQRFVSLIWTTDTDGGETPISSQSKGVQAVLKLGDTGN